MRPRRTLAFALALVVAVVLAASWLARSALRPAPPADGPVDASPSLADARAQADAGTAWELPVPSPSTGWEEAAETVTLDLRGFLLGRPGAGAYEEARAEAARRDLALFPPDPSRLRRLLLSPQGHERALALAALSARGEATDDLVRIALRSARAEDDEVLRLLLAELAAALPADELARHEDDLLRAFAREPNPLVLAVALPALERLAPDRLRSLLEAQLGVAAPEMIPVLAALARDRLGPEGLASIGVLVFHGTGARRE